LQARREGEVAELAPGRDLDQRLVLDAVELPDPVADPPDQLGLQGAQHGRGV
jgi:hypothetical protein